MLTGSSVLLAIGDTMVDARPVDVRAQTKPAGGEQRC